MQLTLYIFERRIYKYLYIYIHRHIAVVVPYQQKVVSPKESPPHGVVFALMMMACMSNAQVLDGFFQGCWCVGWGCLGLAGVRV